MGPQGVPPDQQTFNDDARAAPPPPPCPGMLPTETVPVREFGVSRHTVRAALHHLIIDGLIERRAGRGTTMAKGTSRAEWSIEVIEDLIDIAFASHYDVRSAKFAPFGRRVDAPYVPSKDLATLRR